MDNFMTPMTFGFDWTFALLIPAFIFALWAQFKVSSTFKKFSQYGAQRGITADQVAAQILAAYGVRDVRVEATGGHLTDHYDPRAKVLRLSQSVYGSNSIAAIGVAAHEAGHAIQHARGYTPITIRNAIYPVANIGSILAIPLFFVGLLFASLHFLLTIGIILFAGAVVFHIITLPVEFDASSRALKVLRDGSYLTPPELGGARKVLTAAGLTYVASAVMAAIQLIRLILISRE